jgi:thiol:disulfide interchange protein DsbC
MNTQGLKTMTYLALCALSLSACTQDRHVIAAVAAHGPEVGQGPPSVGIDGSVGPSREAAIRAALKKLDPDLEPDHVGDAAVPGYQEVIVGGDVVYVTNDGRYLVRGLLDLRNGRDMAQHGSLPGLRLKALGEIPASERVVFAPIGPRRHTVTVFTDVGCGYCRKLHEDIGAYNKLGIAIEYVAFPRSGLGTPDAREMASVWCSDDRRQALTDAKNGTPIASRACDNPVAKHHAIGQRIGVQGTPMIINADGVALPGYMPPKDLLEALDRLAAQRKTQQ